MPDETTQPAQVTEQVKGTTTISFSSPTPMWMTWAFRFEFFLNKAIMIWLSSVDIFSAHDLKTFLGTLAAIDFFVWGIARSIGVKPPEDK